MEETVREERKKWIEELTEAIGRADSFLKEACEYYQWDMKDLEKLAKENYMICPFDKSHVVPEGSMHKHLESCEWRALGYTKDCKPLPESAISTESPFTIKFDIDLQFKVLQEAKQKNRQLDIDRLTSDFTRDERKAMYEYVIAHTLAPDVGQDIQDLNKPEKKEERSTSLLELLAQERNLKRRKTRYRGVHTNKKSHIEIMREVVQQQMEMYKEYLVDKHGVQILDEDQENSCNNVKNETRSSSHSELSSSKSRSRDSLKSRDHITIHRESTKHHSNDSHRSHYKDYDDKHRESHKHRSSDYSKSIRHSSQYKDRDYKSHSKDSSRRRDYRDDDEYDYKSRDRYEDKNYSRKHSDKSIADDTKEYRDKSKSFRDGNRDHNNSDKSYHKDKDNQRDSRKRDRSSSVDKKFYFKPKDDSNSHGNYEKRENGHKSKKHKSDQSSKEKKHKKSKHKHKSRSRSRS